MGNIVPRAELARASRARLASRMQELTAIPGSINDPTLDGKIGALIHAESMLAYELCDVPAQLRSAPWLHVIGKMKEEMGLNPETVHMLSRCVSVHLNALLKARPDAGMASGLRTTNALHGN